VAAVTLLIVAEPFRQMAVGAVIAPTLFVVDWTVTLTILEVAVQPPFDTIASTYSTEAPFWLDGQVAGLVVYHAPELGGDAFH
jgi:hypothetical protein